MSYSPVLTMGVWLGNPDTTILKNGTSSLGSPIVASTMQAAHEVYASEGRYTPNQWYNAPNGVQRVGNEVYPSWWSRTQGQANAKLTFDRVSRFKATECTPDAARIELDVVRTTDPVTKRDSYSNVPDGYDATKDDNAHNCGDVRPNINNVSVSGSAGEWEISVSVSQGTFGLDGATATITVDGQSVPVSRTGSTFRAEYGGTANPRGKVNVTILDRGYYGAQASG